MADYDAEDYDDDEYDDSAGSKQKAPAPVATTARQPVKYVKTVKHFETNAIFS